MNASRNLRGVPASVPVLLIVPTGETPALREGNLRMFGQMRKHALTRLYEPDARHLEAPAASIGEALAWFRAVAAAAPK